MSVEPDIQRISRLTPLDDLLAVIATEVAPVVSRRSATASSVNRVLAADVVIEHPLPTAALALRDGFAVRFDETTDAGGYAPAPLSLAARINAGEALPAGADAVLPVDAVMVSAGLAHALSPVAPGGGVLAAGGDIAAGTTLLPAGRRISAADAAVLMAAGIDLLSVRIPFLRMIPARPVADAGLDAIVMHLEAAAGRSGCVVKPSGPLADVLRADGDDLVVIVGGTGSGVNDGTVRTLAAAGEVKLHGIALHPGETAAFGVVKKRPVLALPGRLDAALAVWHLVGQPLLARLSGCIEPLPTRTATLTHKIASTVGVSELVPVRCEGPRATPIASGYVPLAALALADGWVLVRPESEGFPAGGEVVIRPFP